MLADAGGSLHQSAVACYVPKPLITVWRTNCDRLWLSCSVITVLMAGVLHGMLAAIAPFPVATEQRFNHPVVHELGQLSVLEILGCLMVRLMPPTSLA